MSDQVGSHEDRFSNNEAQIINKISCVHFKDSDQPGHLPSLINFQVMLREKAQAPSLLLSATYLVHSKDSDQTERELRLI